jgi:hypothetical protein
MQETRMDGADPTAVHRPMHRMAAAGPRRGSGDAAGVVAARPGGGRIAVFRPAAGGAEAMPGRVNAAGSLLPRLAARSGADIALALETGRLSPAEAAAARRRCAGCAWAAECAARLEARSGRALPPTICRDAANAALIGALAGALSGGVS